MGEVAPLVAALFGAVAFGGGDMLGACATRRLPSYSAAAASQVAAVAFLYLFMSSPTGSSLGPGAALGAFMGGLAHGLALMLLFHGLARGLVGVVAPLCAMSSIIVPLFGDLVLGRHVGAPQLAGIALCMIASVLIAGAVGESRSGRGTGWSMAIGIASGMAYGTADVILATIPEPDSNAILLVARGACVCLAVAVMIAMTSRQPTQTLLREGNGHRGGALAFDPAAVRHVGIALALAAGVFDVLGQIGYMHAATRGSMAVASAATALFPAVTILLAVVFFRERVSPIQLVGYGVATAAVLLLAA